MLRLQSDHFLVIQPEGARRRGRETYPATGEPGADQRTKSQDSLGNWKNQAYIGLAMPYLI